MIVRASVTRYAPTIFVKKKTKEKGKKTGEGAAEGRERGVKGKPRARGALGLGQAERAVARLRSRRSMSPHHRPEVGRYRVPRGRTARVERFCPRARARTVRDSTRIHARARARLSPLPLHRTEIGRIAPLFRLDDETTSFSRARHLDTLPPCRWKIGLVVQRTSSRTRTSRGPAGRVADAAISTGDVPRDVARTRDGGSRFSFSIARESDPPAALDSPTRSLHSNRDRAMIRESGLANGKSRETNGRRVASRRQRRASRTSSFRHWKIAR